MINHVYVTDEISNEKYEIYLFRNFLSQYYTIEFTAIAISSNISVIVHEKSLIKAYRNSLIKIKALH